RAIRAADVRAGSGGPLHRVAECDCTSDAWHRFRSVRNAQMTNSAPDLPVYKNPLLPIPQRVDGLISRMSPAQKLAQLNCTALRFIEAERSEAVMGQGLGHFALSIASGETIEQNAAMVESAQRFLVEQTELGIPALV